MSRWTYKYLQLKNCTEDERKKWKSKGESLGYRTLSSYVKELLKNYQDLGLEDNTGETHICISGIDGKSIDVKEPKKRSRYIRYFINQKIKEGEK